MKHAFVFLPSIFFFFSSSLRPQFRHVYYWQCYNLTKSQSHSQALSSPKHSMSPEHGHARNLLDCLTIPQPIPPRRSQATFLPLSSVPVWSHISTQWWKTKQWLYQTSNSWGVGSLYSLSLNPLFNSGVKRMQCLVATCFVLTSYNSGDLLKFLNGLLFFSLLNGYFLSPSFWSITLSFLSISVFI